MAEIIHSFNKTAVVDTHLGITLGEQELPSPPEPVLHVGEPNTLTENQAGSRWVVGERGATYICGCGCTQFFDVGVFTKFPLKAKCCVNALPLERQ